jgi:hypothetical protein
VTTATMPLSASISEAARPAKNGFFARFYNALMEARMRAAMREIRMHQHLLQDDVTKDLGTLPFVRGA